MTARFVKIGILAISVGIESWLTYEAVASDVTYQRIILLLYVALVIAAILLLPARQAVGTKDGQLTRDSEAAVGSSKVETHSEKAARDVVLEAIRIKGKAKRNDLLPLVTVSKSTLVRLLDEMEAEGLVVQVGERKSSYYRMKDR